MNVDSLARLDLNLLVTLQVLLEEESVTRAAARLHLSQSALSKCLTRLRVMLGDPLFTRTAHGLKPTSHALLLKSQLPQLLQGLYQLSLPPSFEPSTSERKFTFAMLESSNETLLPHFIRPIFTQAPQLNLSIYGWSEKSLQDLQMGYVDFGFAARELHPTADARLSNLPAGINHQEIYHDKQVCLIRANHPMLKKLDIMPWDIDAYMSLPHVQVRCEGRDRWLLDYHLAELNLHRRICATFPDFYGAVSVCSHSDMVMTLPSSFVPYAKKLYDLVELPLPLDLAGITYVLLWHERNDNEPGHQWVRKTITNCLKDNVYELG